MRLLLAFLLGLGCAPSLLAQPLPFAGRWLLDTQAASRATYSVLSVKDDRLRWSGPNKSVPPCEQEFALKKEKPASRAASRPIC